MDQDLFLFSVIVAGSYQITKEIISQKIQKILRWQS